MKSNIDLEQAVQRANWEKIFKENTDYYKRISIEYFNKLKDVLFVTDVQCDFEHIYVKTELSYDLVIKYAFDMWFEEMSTFDYIENPFPVTGTPMSVQKELISTYPDIVAEYATDDYKQLHKISD